MNMTTARIIDATRYPGGVMLHLDKVPSLLCHRIRIDGSVYNISPSLDLGTRLSIASSFPADYYTRHNSAEFLDE